MRNGRTAPAVALSLASIITLTACCHASALTAELILEPSFPLILEPLLTFESAAAASPCFKRAADGSTDDDVRLTLLVLSAATDDDV